MRPKFRQQPIQKEGVLDFGKGVGRSLATGAVGGWKTGEWAAKRAISGKVAASKVDPAGAAGKVFDPPNPEFEKAYGSTAPKSRAKAIAAQQAYDKASREREASTTPAMKAAQEKAESDVMGGQLLSIPLGGAVAPVAAAAGGLYHGAKELYGRAREGFRGATRDPKTPLIGRLARGAGELVGHAAARPDQPVTKQAKPARATRARPAPGA
jgi:hypothetical protein